MAIYIQIGGSTGIKGNVSTEGHDRWIEVESMQFGVDRLIPMLVGKQTQRESSLPVFSEVSFQKLMDDASPYIFQQAMFGKASDITVHVTTTSQESPGNVVEYTLGAAMVSNYTFSASSDIPTESFTIAYTKIEMKYIVWNESGEVDTAIPVAYDLGLAKKG